MFHVNSCVNVYNEKFIAIFVYAHAATLHKLNINDSRLYSVSYVEFGSFSWLGLYVRAIA